MATAPTVAVIPAAADEVSVSIAHLFSQHAQDYQAQAGRAAAFHEQFVQHLTASAGSFASAEATNAASLHPLTAGAASFTSAIATFLGQLLDLLNSAIAALVQLLNSLAGLLLPLIREAIAFLTAFFFLFVLPALNLLFSCNSLSGRVRRATARITSVIYQTPADGEITQTSPWPGWSP